MIRRRLVSTCKHDQAQGGHCTSTCRQNQPGWGSTPCCCQEPATTHASIRVRTHTHTRGMKVWCSPPPHTPHTNTLCRGRGRLPTNCRGRSPPHCRWAGTCGTRCGRPPRWRWCPPPSPRTLPINPSPPTHRHIAVGQAHVGLIAVGRHVGGGAPQQAGGALDQAAGGGGHAAGRAGGAGRDAQVKGVLTRLAWL